MDKIYIVTGATGFVGNHIVRMLVDRGETVRGLVRSESKAKEVFGDLPVELYYGDTRNIDDVEACFANGGRFVVIHTAAIVSIGDRRLEKDIYSVNVGGTKNVIEACLRHKAERLLHVSSIHAVPEKGTKGRKLVEVDSFDPALVVGHYAKTKAITSQMVLDAGKKGLNAVIVQPTGIMGPDDYSDTHLTQMVEDFDAGRIPASVKGGYDIVDVRDVAKGTLLACDKGRAGESYLLSGAYVSAHDLLNEVCRALGGKPLKITMPMWVAKLSLPFLLLYSKIRRQRPLYTAYSLYTLNSNADISHDKATTELGYLPRPLAETVQDTVGFLRERGAIRV